MKANLQELMLKNVRAFQEISEVLKKRGEGKILSETGGNKSFSVQFNAKRVLKNYLKNHLKLIEAVKGKLEEILGGSKPQQSSSGMFKKKKESEIAETKKFDIKTFLKGVRNDINQSTPEKDRKIEQEVENSFKLVIQNLENFIKKSEDEENVEPRTSNLDGVRLSSTSSRRPGENRLSLKASLANSENDLGTPAKAMGADVSTGSHDIDIREVDISVDPEDLLKVTGGKGGNPGMAQLGADGFEYVEGSPSTTKTGSAAGGRPSHEDELEFDGDVATHFTSQKSRYTNSRAGRSWLLHKGTQVHNISDNEEMLENLLQISKTKILDLETDLNKMLKFNFSIDKFKIDPIYDSGFGKLMEVFDDNTFLVKNLKGRLYLLTVDKKTDQLNAIELSYKGVPLIILKTVYLSEPKILYLADKEFLYKVENGKISIEDELQKEALSILKKSEEGSTVLYIKNYKTLKIIPSAKYKSSGEGGAMPDKLEFASTFVFNNETSLYGNDNFLREMKASSLRASKISDNTRTVMNETFRSQICDGEQSANSILIETNIIDAFLPTENIVCVVDGSYIYRAYRLEVASHQGSLDESGFDEPSGLVSGASKIVQIASQRIYGQELRVKGNKREFYSSRNHLTVVSRLSSVDMFKYTPEFHLEYVASLKVQMSPVSIVRTKLELFGNPVLSIFQLRQDGFFEVTNYLYFDNKFISVGNKERPLLFKGVTFVGEDKDSIVVVCDGLEYYRRISFNF